MTPEGKVKKEFIEKLKERFPGCLILRNDPTYIQGIPDLTVLYKKHWAAFECKESANAPHRPNQDYYVQGMNEMSYASFVYPENMEDVLNDLEQTFKRSSRRCSCISGS